MLGMANAVGRLPISGEVRFLRHGDPLDLALSGIEFGWEYALNP